MGFEPTRRLDTAYAISNRAPSANSDTSPGATDGSLPCLSNVVEIPLKGSVALEARAKCFQRQGPQYPVDGELGALPLGAIRIGDEVGDGGDQVRGVAVGALDAPGEVLERDPRHQPFLPGAWVRDGSRALLAETYVLHQDRGDDGERDGGEGKDETVMDRLREAFAGDLQDLLYESLPAGEG